MTAGRLIRLARRLALACLLIGAAAGAQAPLLSTTGSLRPGGGTAHAAAPAQPGHMIQLAAGQRVRITAASEDFDTVVRLFRPGKAAPIAENDDAEGSLNSRLLFTAADAAEYRIEVTAFSPDETGSYRLEVSSAPALPAPVTVAASTSTSTFPWRLFEGALSASDPEGSEGRFDDFQVALTKGRPVVILLDAIENAFDPLVHVYTAEGREGTPVATNDDGGTGLGSMLFFTPPETGDYVIRVTSFADDGAGAYRLRIGDIPLPM